MHHSGVVLLIMHSATNTGILGLGFLPLNAPTFSVAHPQVKNTPELGKADRQPAPFFECAIMKQAACSQDREDDVRAVSAEALLPVVSLLAQQRSQAASEVEDALWDLLLDVDDLSVSTGASLVS